MHHVFVSDLQVEAFVGVGSRERASPQILTLQIEVGLREDSPAFESDRIGDTVDYAAVAGLSREVVEKLSRIAPRTLGQAGRISGVTPAALSCLEIHLKKYQG